MGKQVLCIFLAKHTRCSRSSTYSRCKLAPSNIPFVILGTGMLWFGWFGFNAGSGSRWVAPHETLPRIDDSADGSQLRFRFGFSERAFGEGGGTRLQCATRSQDKRLPQFLFYNCVSKHCQWGAVIFYPQVSNPFMPRDWCAPSCL